jgi:Tfp pilus assembly protein PilN
MAIKVNLLPREDRPRRARFPAALARPSIGRANYVVPAAAAVFLVAALGVGVAFYRSMSERGALRREVANLRVEDAQLKSRLTELELVRSAKREIERRIEILGKVAKSQKVPLAMMTGVMTAVPQGVWLTSFEMKPQEVQVQVEAKRPPIASSPTVQALEEKKQEAAGARPGAREVKTVSELRGFAVSLKGLAFNNQQVADLMDNLRKAGFSDVDFIVTQATNVEQVRVTSFELSATVKL